MIVLIQREGKGEEEGDVERIINVRVKQKKKENNQTKHTFPWNENVT